jgi:hypothetical protein
MPLKSVFCAIFLLKIPHQQAMRWFWVFDKLEFGGQWPLTMRAWCSAFRYCPDPLGIVTAEQLDKLEFV